MALPCGLPSVALAQADLNGGLALSDLVEQHPSEALRVILENGPHEQGFFGGS